MPDFACPSCKTLVRISRVGDSSRCPICGTAFAADAELLARFNLPRFIRVRLCGADGKAFTDFPVPVFVDYGYRLPPLLTDRQGELTISSNTFAKAKRDEVATGLMDHKGDYALNRYVRIIIRSRAQALAVAKDRAASGWPATAFEEELYGNLEALCAAHVPPQEITPTEAIIDLAEGKTIVERSLLVIKGAAPCGKVDHEDSGGH
jgi:hypothetical protein